jgi:hypothetical protein
MRYLLVLSLLIAIGCKQPVATPCPKLPSPPDVALRVTQLAPDAPIEEVLKAYVLDLADQIGLSKQRKAIIEAHNKD